MSDDISTFLDMKALRAENARLRAALEKIAKADLILRDGFIAACFMDFARETLAATDVLKPTNVSSSEEQS